jgi:hypothetical protein
VGAGVVVQQHRLPGRRHAAGDALAHQQPDRIGDVLRQADRGGHRHRVAAALAQQERAGVRVQGRRGPLGEHLEQPVDGRVRHGAP